jgi:hypothetical protein
MFTLTDAEARVLVRALDAYLPELSYEVARIELMARRRGLAEEERQLRALRERLALELGGEPAPAGAT